MRVGHPSWEIPPNYINVLHKWDLTSENVLSARAQVKRLYEYKAASAPEKIKTDIVILYLYV